MSGMNLAFNDCKIRHDGLQYILTVDRVQKEGKNKGNTVSKTLGYYATESQLLTGLIKHGLGCNAITTVREIACLIDEAVRKIESSRG